MASTSGKKPSDDTRPVKEEPQDDHADPSSTTGVRPYTCGQCGSTYLHKRSLRRHEVKKHCETVVQEDIPSSTTGVRPYTCSQCGSTYSHERSLIRHGVEKHYETVAGEDIPLKRRLQMRENGKREDRVWKRDDGERENVLPKIRSTSLASAEQPLRIGSGEVSEREPQEALCTCPACLRSFEEYADLVSHAIRCRKYLRTVRKEQSEQEKMAPQGHEEKRRYTCAICRKIFSGVMYFADHLKEAHSGTLFLVHVCEDC